MTAQHILLLKTLWDIKSNGPYDRMYGICMQVDSAMLSVPYEECDSVDAIMYDLFTKWPEYSGDEMFPVPHPVFNVFYGYSDASEKGTMWKGLYGSARIRLLNFMIRELEANINV